MSLAAALAASELLVRGLEALGRRFALSEGLIGLLAALGTDSPELSAALVAMHAGARDLGLGVVLGSNIFNLAALLGLSAILAGRVHVRRWGLALNGGVAVGATLLAGGILRDGGSAEPLSVLFVVMFVAYVGILAFPPPRLRRVRFAGPLSRIGAVAVHEINRESVAPMPDRIVAPPAGLPWGWLALMIPVVAVIVLASTGIVTATLHLAGRWGVSPAIVGVLALAALTSLPNAYAAVRLALQHRGNAVVSAAFNSNTINLMGGVVLPVLVLPGAAGATGAGPDLLWLLGMTGLVIALLARRSGLTRPGATAVVALYLLFVVFRLAR